VSKGRANWKRQTEILWNSGFALCCWSMCADPSMKDVHNWDVPAHGRGVGTRWSL